MDGFKGFEDILAWQKARTIVSGLRKEVYGGPAKADFEFRNQIMRAAYSVMSNIAEGYERGGNTEFKHFLAIAKGSAAEVKSLLYVALDAGYVKEMGFNDFRNKLSEISAMLTGLIKHINNSSMKGFKYKKKT